MSHLCLILLGGMKSGECQLEVEPRPPKSIEPECSLFALSILRSVRLEIPPPTIHPVGTTYERLFELLAFIVSPKPPNVKSVAHAAVHFAATVADASNDLESKSCPTPWPL